MYARRVTSRILALMFALAACNKDLGDPRGHPPVDLKTAMQAVCDAYPATGTPTPDDLAESVQGALLEAPNEEVVVLVATLGPLSPAARASKLTALAKRSGLTSCRWAERIVNVKK